jgi:hypothetical protein
MEVEGRLLPDPEGEIDFRGRQELEWRRGRREAGEGAEQVVEPEVDVRAVRRRAGGLCPVVAVDVPEEGGEEAAARPGARATRPAPTS